MRAASRFLQHEAFLEIYYIYSCDISMLYIEYASHVFADCVEEQRKENKQPADETQELKEEVWVPNKQPAAEAQELIEGAQGPEKQPAVESQELTGEKFNSWSFSSHRPFGPPPAAAVVSGCHGEGVFLSSKVTVVAVSCAFATSQVEAFEWRVF